MLGARIDQDKARHLVPVTAREQPCGFARQRMRDQHIGARDVRLREKPVQFVCGSGRCARRGARVAPAHARAVVGANPRGGRELRLDQAPVERRSAQPRVEDDGGAARTGAMDVESKSADIDQAAGCGIGVRIAVDHSSFVGGTGASQGNGKRAERKQAACDSAQTGRARRCACRCSVHSVDLVSRSWRKRPGALSRAMRFSACRCSLSSNGGRPCSCKLHRSGIPCRKRKRGCSGWPSGPRLSGSLSSP